MRSYVLILFFAFLVVFAIFSPFVGLLGWTAIVYVNPQNYIWGFGTDIRYVMIIAVVTILSTIVHGAARNVKLTASSVFFILLTLWISLTTVFSLNPEEGVDVYIEIMKLFTLAVMTALLIDDQRKLHMFLYTMVGAIALFGIKGGIFGILTGGNYLIYGPQGSFISANNAIALALIMMIPMIWYLSGISEKPYARFLGAIFIFLCCVSIFISYSRGAFLGMAGMFAYWIWSSKYKTAGILSLVFAGIVALMFMPEEWLARMQSIRSYDEDGSAVSRLEIWGFAFEVAKDRLFGGGFGIFSMYDLYESYGVDLERIGYIARSAHSIYFETLGAHGFVGLFLFLGFWISTFRLLGKIRKRDGVDIRISRCAFAIQASLVGYAVGGAFVNKAFEWPISYQLAAVALVLHRLTEEKASEPSTTGVPAPAANRRVREAIAPAKTAGRASMAGGPGRGLRPMAQISAHPPGPSNRYSHR